MDVLSLRLFLRIAELGAISAAARDLVLSPASASARLVKLEESLGTRLFHRTTRAVSLTTDGAAFLPYAQQSVEVLEAGMSILGGRIEQVQGVLRMAMPGSFGRMYVIPLLSTFCEQYPLVELDLRLSDEVLDVIEGAFDLIIRNAPLQDSSLIARKLASDKRLLVAAPSYLERCGVPSNPKDLTNHHHVILSGSDKYVFESGEAIHVPRSFAVNDGEAMRLMLEQGLGIGLKSLWNVSQSLQDGRLVEVLSAYPLVTTSAIWALYPDTRVVAPKVRAMIDFLLHQFSPVPVWEKTQTET